MLLGSGIGIRIPFPIVGVLRFDFGLGIINSKINQNLFILGSAKILVEQSHYFMVMGFFLEQEDLQK